MNAVAIVLPVLALLQPAGTPKFDARMLAAHDAIQPGGQTELAIEITVQDDWHIYDSIILDTGMPTDVVFELPDGFETGPVRFPPPYLGEEADLEYLAHSGRIIVLTTLSAPEDAELGPQTINAQVFALACKKLCLPVQAKTSLTIDVLPNEPQPTNTRLFESAREQVAPVLGSAGYIEGSRVFARHAEIPVQGDSEIVAVINIRKDHVINDRDPGDENLIPSRLFVESRPGIKLRYDAQQWSPPDTEKVAGIGTVRKHAGRLVIRLPFEIDDAEFEPGPIDLRVLFEYQPCEKGGQCFMPVVAAGEASFEVVPAGAPAVERDDPIVAKLDELTRAGDSSSGASMAGKEHELSIPMVFLFAFLGGVILNIMPCVLPVISLKIFGFVQQAGDDPRRIFNMGLVYAAGIMASFAVIAVVMAWAGLAWGGAMQSPSFLIGLSALVFAFSLSLLGVFELQLPGAVSDAASNAASKEGYGGAFMNGVMATLLATPCVGPFLAPAVGVLATLPPAVASAGVMTVGLGLAAPYVLLSAFPAWLKFLPKPGPWMITFKQIVGFILIIVVLWLLSILVQMVDKNMILGTLGLLCAVGIGSWVLGKVTLSMTWPRTATMWGLALVIMLGGGWSSFAFFAERETKIPWQSWEPGIGPRLASEGYAVYIDYTASWCMTCQTNKKLVLETNRVAGEFKKLGIYPIKADFTAYDPEMQKELLAHGRNGVPLNLVFSPEKPDDPIVLPEVLTRSIVLDALDEVGASESPPSFWEPQPEKTPSVAQKG